MEKIKDFDNRLLKRKEVILDFESDKTPSKQEIQQLLSKEFDKAEEVIVVDKIKGKFGSHTFRIEAKLYDDVDSKDKYEIITQKERKKRAEEAKKVEEEKKKAEEEAAKAAEEAKTQEETTSESEKKSEDSNPSEAPIEEPKSEPIQEDTQPEKQPNEQPKEEESK
jgi:ribosomal protein S24E